MISQSKKKRLHIMEQISQRNRDKSRQSNKRQTSAERRKKIQANFNDFVHTMHNFPFSHSKSKFSNQSVKFNTGSMFYKQQNQNHSPSVKDIQPEKNINSPKLIANERINNQNMMKSQQKAQNIQQLAYSKFSQDSNSNVQIKKDQKQEKKNQNQVDTNVKDQIKQNKFSQNLENFNIQMSPDKVIQQRQEEIVYNLSGNSGLSNSRNKSTHTQQLSAIKQQPIQEKQKLLFQTSKFNTVDINNQKDADIIDEGEEIKVPVNLITTQNRQDAVSNDSSAIFFTSQFHQFINRQKNQNKQEKNPQENEQNQSFDKRKLNQNNQQIFFDKLDNNQKDISQKQTHKRHNTQFQQPNNTHQKSLARNKSGRSIADSNASSLKYSLYESNVNAHQMLSYKLTNELVVDADNFLYPTIKMLIFVDKIQQKQLSDIVRNIKLFKKLWVLKQKIQKREVTQYFDAFIVNKELNFQEKKNQIKAQNYIKQKEQYIKIFAFGTLKKYCFSIVKKKQQKALQFYQNLQTTLIEKCFRNIKIGWYNRKVNQQVQLYYLSKIFYHLKKICKKQQSIDRNKVLHFYSKNMKQKFFKYFIQGVNNLQNQRIQNQNAQWHFDYNLMKKCMEGWKQKVSNQNKFISLAMTTKNAFKQTQDNKWMQIKTVDFRQLK